MKKFLSIALVVACIALIAALVITKRDATAQQQKDAADIASVSNQWVSAQTVIVSCYQTLAVCSNRLDEAQAIALTMSNTLSAQLLEAKTALARGAEQITNLNQQITALESNNQTLDRHIMDLTNQIAGLTSQTISNRAILDEANRNYTLLENRFHRDVAERVIVERKFNNLAALKTQMEYLKLNPAQTITVESIREGLDVIVTSNKAYVISPD